MKVSLFKALEVTLQGLARHGDFKIFKICNLNPFGNEVVTAVICLEPKL